MGTALMLREADVVAPDGVRAVIARMGRTEDVSFSPDNRRLAVAGFGEDRVFLLDVLVDDRPTGVRLHATGITELTSPSLREPHGLCFINDHTLVVANRAGEAPILRLPPPAAGARTVEVVPLQTIRADELDGLQSPGSVWASRIAPDLYEIHVCNNYANTVSVHVVDARDGYRVMTSEVVLAAGLAIPDGITGSPDGRWLAVSNHDTHSVLAYRTSPLLGPHSSADGVLSEMAYPHGLCFTPDGCHVLVADAAAPCVHVFATSDGDWTGQRTPVRSIQVMDDETFLRGAYNPQEGGPKGLDIDRTSRVLVVSSEHQPLALFDLRDVVPGLEPGSRWAGDPEQAHENEASRARVVREIRRTTALERTVAALRGEVVEDEATIGELAAAVSGLEATVEGLRAELADAQAAAHHERLVAEDRARQLLAIHQSTSWRATAAARRVGARLRPLRKRSRQLL